MHASDGEVLARAALARYPVSPDARLTLVRRGENTTYRVTDSSGSMALRLARPGYHTPAAIGSEIAWMSALRDEGIRTPAPVAGRDGEPVQRVARQDGTTQVAVAFKWVEGAALPDVGGAAAWSALGEVMARIHEHSRRWVPPPGFERPAWDAEALVGDDPRWGTPLPPGVWPDADRELLLSARDAVRERLSGFGTSRERFGLIHADLGFENVLVQDGGRTVIIDFDDSGPSWFLYELASVLYPLEGEPGFAEARDALIAGYRRPMPLEEGEAEELTTFLMCRRLATLGWTFSRADTDHARRQRERRLRTSPQAARDFLAWHAERGSAG